MTEGGERHRRAAGPSAAVIHLLGGALALVGTLDGWLMVLALLPGAVALLTAGHRDASIRAEARAALNFQITWVGAALVLLVATLVLVNLLVAHAPLLAKDYYGIGTAALLLVALVDAVLSVVATARARSGGGRYPLSFHPVA